MCYRIKEVIDIYTFTKVLKHIVLCLLSAILLTGILFFMMLIFATLGNFNEYVLASLAGLIHFAIVLLAGYKFINKICVSKGIYFLFTTLIPAVIFNLICAIYHYLNNSITILDKGAELGYYLIFVSIAFSVSFIAFVIIVIVSRIRLYLFQ